MKTRKYILSFLLWISPLLLMYANSYAQSDKAGRFEKHFQISAEGNLKLDCYNGDLTIHTSNDDEVTLTGHLQIRGGDEDDRRQLIEAFQSIDANKSGNSLKIDTRFYKKINSGILNNKKITLRNGKKVKVGDFNFDYLLNMPQSMALDLNSKYNKVKAHNLKGKLKMELYNSELDMYSVEDDYSLRLAYTSGKINTMGNGSLELYDSEIEIRSTKDLNLSSKYSELDLRMGNNIKLESYDDELNFKHINSLEGEAKYSELHFGDNLESCNLTLYDSDVEAGNINSLELEAKYSNVKTGRLSNFFASKLYENEIDIQRTEDFRCLESKYDQIQISSVSKNIEMFSVYNTDFKVNKIYPSLKSFTGDFKYSTVKMDLPDDLKYKIDFDIQHGKVDFDKEPVKGKIYETENNNWQKFKGISTEGDPTCEIKFTGYDSDFSFE